MATSRVLVTGGAGFLGSHLCDLLVKEGKYVICLDNFYTGTKSNIEHLVDLPNFEFLEHDIINSIDIEVNEIYNLACPASPVHYQKDAIYTWKTSVFGMYNMLELAKKNNARILQASTSEIYGDPEVHPQEESYWGNVNPIGIRSCYDEGKRAAETLCFDYARQHGTDIRVVRIFNTYGPRMMIDDGRVVSNFIKQALVNEDITLYGGGSQTRSFCYVSDLIQGFFSFMESENAGSGPYNLGNPNEMTVKELAHEVLNLIVNSKSKLVDLDLPMDDPKQRKPNISAIASALGWEPKVKLKDGLRLTIESIAERLHIKL